MNGAYRNNESIEGKAAAVIKALLVRFMDRDDATGRSGPDNADISQALRPFMKLWELDIRIDEARTSHSQALTERVKELAILKAKAEMAIPEEFQL